MLSTFALAVALAFGSHPMDQSPAPLLPFPSERQLQWHKLGMYAFAHFGPNTFTGEEWGHGNENPELFNPEHLDCRQWARTLHRAGFKGIIITAKHHDGFCLWPSKLSTHTVAQSKWKHGKGDVLRELSDACRHEGIKFGIYLSPWDRNHPAYGTPEYNQIFASMLHEVLTQYGPIFEVWFDGANGEGPNGKKQVYDWNLFVGTVRKLQPNAVIFSDAGPDVRWVGNEDGHAAETNWALLRRDEFFPGTPRSAELTEGHENGTHWLPAECDVSIRPGWFWRKSEDDKVKSLDHLLDIYDQSVGRGASFLLNVPPNRDGLISEPDVKRLQEFHQAITERFAHPVKAIEAIGEPLRSAEFSGSNATDGRADTYWATPDDARSGTLTLTLDQPTPLTYAVIREPIQLGQRIRKFHVDARSAAGWQRVATGTTVGWQKQIKLDGTLITQLRVVIEDSRACPLISEVALYR